MNLEAIDWSMVASSVAVIGFVYGCYRNLKTDIKEQLKEFRDDLGEFRDEVHSDLSDVKERISFLEATTLYTMPLEPAQLNPRSAAAREMWKKRKAKRLEKKG